MIGCQHERRTDFRTGEIREGVADQHHTPAFDYGLGHCTASPSSME
jgi:hypothetical protein